MSIRKTEKLELSLGGDCLNVMYFEHCESMYFDNAEDESIEVCGVTPGHMATLMRNLVCCRDAKVKLENLKDHEVKSLRECQTKLNQMFAAYDSSETMRGAN